MRRAQRDVAGEVVGAQRLLDPGEVERRQRVDRARRPVSRSQRWFASIMSARSGPITSRTAATRSTSSARSGLPTLILTASKPAVDPALGLGDELVERVVQVHAAAVSAHRVRAPAEQRRQPSAARRAARIPQREVEPRHRDRRDPAAARLVQVPPQRLPHASRRRRRGRRRTQRCRGRGARARPRRRSAASTRSPTPGRPSERTTCVAMTREVTSAPHGRVSGTRISRASTRRDRGQQPVARPALEAFRPRLAPPARASGRPAAGDAADRESATAAGPP